MARFGRTNDRTPAPLSDAVIGSVHTRARGPGYGLIQPIQNNSAANARQNPEYLPSFAALLPPLKTLSPSGSIATSAAEPTQSIELSQASRGFQQHSAHLTPPQNETLDHQDHVNVPNLQQISAFESPSRVVSDAVAAISINPAETLTPSFTRKRTPNIKSEACREQCRNNQARYRQKQREYVSTLEATVVQLRQNIPMLEVERRRLSYDSEQRASDVVAEFFQLFKNGVGVAVEQGSAGPNEVMCAMEAQQQLMFLRSTMANNVEFGNLSGVEAFLDQWRRLSEYHTDFQLQLDHVEKISESIVVAEATMSVTITNGTLESIFPHLMGSETVEDLSLAVKLLGQRLSYPCSMLFAWDEASNLVERLETDMNMVMPLAGLLGNMEDASRVLQGAVIFPKSRIS